VPRGSGTGSAEPADEPVAALDMELNPAVTAVDGVADEATYGDAASGAVPPTAADSLGRVGSGPAPRAAASGATLPADAKAPEVASAVTVDGTGAGGSDGAAACSDSGECVDSAA
jgi:hypothetical protein